MFDAKNELIQALDSLRRAAITGLVNADPITRGPLMIATHAVLVVSAFFTELADQETAAEASHGRLDVRRWPTLDRSAIALMVGMRVPVPSPMKTSSETDFKIWQLYSETAALFNECLVVDAPNAHLPAIRRLQFQLLQHLPSGALRRYRKYVLAVAAKVPAFTIWTLFDDDAPRGSQLLPAPPEDANLARLRRQLGMVVVPAVSGSEIGTMLDEVRACLDRQPAGLSGFHGALDRVERRPQVADQWAELAEFYLDEVTRDATEHDQGAPRLPVLRDLYVNPGYRAKPFDLGNDHPHEEAWWEQVPAGDEVQGFLVRYLLSPSATLMPLLVLGHPGAGKSAFTRMLAAQLGALGRPVVRVDLRSVVADAPIYLQISKAIERLLSRRLDWAELARTARNAAPVVILDGLDELIQSSAASRADYLELVQEFQRGEAIKGCPVVVVVTSRTVVAHRVRIPNRSMVMRLEPFDEVRIKRWLDRWNEHNARYFAASGLQPLTAPAVLAHQGLAEQPLLLLMLALYDSDGNALQRDGANFAGADLYERLLRRFATREVRKHAPGVEADEVERLAEKELLTLSIAAFAMFNRGSQAVLEDELAADLQTFTAAPSQRTHRLPVPPDKARKLVSRFFFVHVSQATAVDGGGERTASAYEFLHATFGEYLVARHTHRALLHTYESTQRGGHSLSIREEEPDYGLLSALLSFELLCARNTVLAFLGHAVRDTDPRTRQGLIGMLIDVLQNALYVDAWRGFEDYSPRRTSIPERLSIRTANLVLLLVALSNGITMATLFPDAADPAARWRELAALWQATLSPASWQSLTEAFGVKQVGAALHISDLGAKTPLDVYDTVPALDSLRRLSRLTLEPHTQWAFAALEPLLHAVPAVDEALSLMHQAFPLWFGGGVASEAEALLHHRIRLLALEPGAIEAPTLAELSVQLDDLETGAPAIRAELLFEAIRPGRPAPAALDVFREVLCEIARPLGEHCPSARQLHIAIGLARLGIADRDLPSSLCLVSILYEPRHAVRLVDGDWRLAADLIDVIRSTSRWRAAGRAARVLIAVPVPVLRGFCEPDVLFVAECARREYPDAAAHLLASWAEALLLTERLRVARLLRSGLARRMALTRVALALRAAAVDPRQAASEQTARAAL
ncbi:ATP-binding protein [Dactylosporangium sp. NPDC050588]|uniref:NACHT domain-containing protein n=1 Tax=Dactylosporangium sp. NPDC050588 TaxID=3157211 RepID=UPI0033C92E4C